MVLLRLKSGTAETGLKEGTEADTCQILSKRVCLFDMHWGQRGDEKRSTDSPLHRAQGRGVFTVGMLTMSSESSTKDQF